MRECAADIVVVGGGLGGVAAALAALGRGRSVVLAEPTDWLGGQLTSQAVPADENLWIEFLDLGATPTYLALRAGIRDYYRAHYPLTERARARRRLNPGGALVSRISCEPRVALAVIDALLAPHRATGRLTVLLEHRPVAAHVAADRIGAVTLLDTRTGAEVTVSARYVLDATETGDLLALAGVEHVTGAEAQSEHGEPHAGTDARPDAMQAVTHVLAMDHLAGEDHTIDPPVSYPHWRAARGSGTDDPLLGLVTHDVRTGAPATQRFEPNPGDDLSVEFATASPGTITGVPGDQDLWPYRRVLARDNLRPGAVRSDVVVVNWPMNDYWAGSVIPVDGTDGAAAGRHLAQARELSLSVLYWLQTEAPRPDGGSGWPGLRLRPDVTGTPDGLAKAPYIRESRRIRALTTVTENDVALAVRGAHGATVYPDSVGVGSYHIDLHPLVGGGGQVDVATCPFEIPLGALVPLRMRNLLAAAKNIGTTHLTNGCYRLHPVEWAVGEAAGALAAHCLATGAEPHQLAGDSEAAAAFTHDLDRAGVPRHWPDLPRRLAPLISF